jgi:leucine-rich PPR motif-containing protein
MQQASLEPSADTYTTLLCGFARKGDIAKIESLLETCDKKDVYLLDKDYLEVIYALTTNGFGDKVDALISKLRKSAGFNSDAVNTILRLTNKNYEDVAFKILKEMPRSVRNDGELTDAGNFFIKQLVKSNRPVEKILSICNQMKLEGLNAKPLLVAIEAGLVNGLPDLTLPLLKEAQNASLPIKQHYFWPLICASKSKGNDALIDVLSKMQTEFNISPTSETVREYVIPNLKTKNSDELIGLLRSAGLPAAISSTSAIHNVLSSGNLKEAADLATAYNVYYSPGLFRKPLVHALAKTKDFDSYIRFVRQMYEGINKLDQFATQQNAIEEDGVVEPVANSNQREVLGQMIFDAAALFRNNRVEYLTPILNGLVNEGLCISNSQAERIQDLIGADLTSDISTLLGKLSSGDLEPKAIEKQPINRNQTGNLTQMTIEQLERMIKSIESKGDNAKGIKRYLLAAVIRSKDLVKTEEIVKRLHDEGYVLTSGVNAQLIDLYVHHEKLDEALRLYNELRAKESDFALDKSKIIRFASLMITNNQVDEAIKFLEENKREEEQADIIKNNFNYKTTVWRLLNQIAEVGKVEELNRVFNCLMENHYIVPNNVIFGALIKVHLVNSELKNAVDKFEEISNKYKVTPWKNELACKLIQTEDAINLQRVTDLSTNIHGEVNSLYDLVFSFVECGRIRQARKILETPGLKNRPQRINFACERYRQEGMTESLEGLMEATKDLNHIDRGEIFYNLLLSYCKENNPNKALGLWTKLQEENIPPTDQFLIKLSEFLKSNNLEVPFVVSKPESKSTPPSQKAAKVVKNDVKTTITSVDASTPPNPRAEKLNAFRQAIKTGDIDCALISKQNLPASDKLSITDQSLLIEGLIKQSRLNEASKIVKEMLSTNLHPSPRVFRFFLNKVAAAGDILLLEEIGKYLTPDVKKIVSFDNRMCHANIVAGKSIDYLKKLEDDIQNAKTDQEVADIAEKFPRGGAVGILDENPLLADRFEEMAEKYAAKGIIGPMNVLWVHHFIKENTDACNRIWDNHLSVAPRLMFQRIVHLAREKQDEKLIQRLIELLKQTKVSEGAIGNAYSCLLDVYATKEQYENGLIALDIAVKDVCLENINRTALVRIKAGLEKSGKDFPHKIPDRLLKQNDDPLDSSSSSSSSSSDDEKKSTKK